MFLFFRLLLFGVILLASKFNWGKLFYLQLSSAKALGLSSLFLIKERRQKVSSFNEGVYLVFSLSPRRELLTQLIRGRVVIFCLRAGFICF